MRFVWLAVVAIIAVGIASAKEVLELQGTNFELTLTTYKYLAVLFYDDSDLGRKLRDNWAYAAEDIAKLPPDSEIAEVGALLCIVLSGVCCSSTSIY